MNSANVAIYRSPCFPEGPEVENYQDHSKMCAYWLLSKVNADFFSIASEEIPNEIPAQCIGSQNLRIGIRKILVKGVLNLLRRAF